MSNERANDPADEQLLDRFRQGDAKAFEELMRRHRKPLFNFVLRMVLNRQTAEEIHQEAWLRVIQGVRGFDFNLKFTTWMYSITRNLCLDHLRKQTLRRHPSLDQPTGRGGDEGAPLLGELVKDPQPEVDRQAIGQQLQVRLLAALDELPSEQREVFVLRQYGDHGFREIGLIVGVSENTAKSRMRYALERLQESLGDYEDYARALG